MLTEQKTQPTARSTGHMPGLLVGDLAMFGLFVLIGRRSHSEAVSPREILHIAAPFAIGWLAVAPWFKLFRADVYRNFKAVLGRTALAWSIAAPIGLALRTFVWGREFKLPFAITTFLFNLVILLIWRGLAARKLGKH